MRRGGGLRSKACLSGVLVWRGKAGRVRGSERRRRSDMRDGPFQSMLGVFGEAPLSRILKKNRREFFFLGKGKGNLGPTKGMDKPLC